MSNVPRLVVAVGVLIAFGAVGVAACSPATGAGQPGPPSASTQPSDISSDSPASSGLPALSKAFTSRVNGYSISYPGDWKVVTATETWPTGSPNFNPDDPSVDSFSGPNLAIYVASQKIASGVSPAQWLDRYMSDAALDFSNRPDCATVKTQPIVVDGATGSMNYSCSVVLIDAVVTAGGRAYVFSLQGDTLDKAWLLDLLKTVKLDPAGAIDTAPSASPS
jgi:hypothetical protein